MNDQLHKFYGEKIIQWRELAGRWDLQDCKAQELMEARGAMEILAALVTGDAKKRE